MLRVANLQRLWLLAGCLSLLPLCAVADFVHMVPGSELSYFDQQVSIAPSNPISSQTDDFPFTLPDARDVSIEANYFAKYGDGNTEFTFSLFDAAINQVGSSEAFGLNSGNIWEGTSYADLQPGAYTEKIAFEGTELGFPAGYDFRLTSSPTVSPVPEPGGAGLVLIGLGALLLVTQRKPRHESPGGLREPVVHLLEALPTD